MIISATLLSTPSQASISGALPAPGQSGGVSSRAQGGAAVSDSFVRSAISSFSTYRGPKAGSHVSTFGEDAPTSATFAADILRRIETGADTDEEALSSLGASLARTIDTIASTYGKNAATAVMGAVYKNIGSETVSEESLGNGFLDAIRLVDKNFGISAGDSFIENLNGDLNDAMNAFFDNGAHEIFYASTSAAQMGLFDERAATAATQAADAMSGIMDALAGTGDVAGARRKKKSLLKEIEEQLEKRLQEKMETSQMEMAIEAYGALDAAYAPGRLLDMAV